jgi:hypothetical protein
MSAIIERFKAARERRRQRGIQRRAEDDATKVERRQRRAQADAIRLEHKRGSGGGGGGDMGGGIGGM